MSFKATIYTDLKKTPVRHSADDAYWNKLTFPVTVKEFTSIDYIDICNTEPHYIAVTTGPKVSIYHQQTTQVTQTLSRFAKAAYGATFRQDGQLLVAGSEECQVKLFNYGRKQLLRVFKGHTGPVHRAKFIQGLPHIISFADDKASKLWDIQEEKTILTLAEHSDFIRAGTVSPASPDIILSGSYDHTVKIWDTRTRSSIQTFNHASPVESLICNPSGSVFASAGGCEVRVWDMIAGKLISVVSQHHKTVTCLTLNADNTRLMSGSLDKHVKIYDITRYNVVHSRNYPASILSMAIAPQDSTLAVGMISGGAGLISFEHRHKSNDTEEEETSSRKSQKNARHMRSIKMEVTMADIVVEKCDQKKISKHDKLLKSFAVSNALDNVVMKNFVAYRTPSVTVGVFRELIRRDALRVSLAGRDMTTLRPIMVFLIKNIRNMKFKRTLLIVANTILDLYEDSMDQYPDLLKHFTRLKREIADEVRMCRDHIALLGAVQMFLTASKPETTEDTFALTVDVSPEN